LRPHKDVVEGLRQAIVGHDEHVLLLGVTPELADLGRTLVGVDKNEMMIAKIWPGDTSRRRVVKADWRALPFAAREFSAAIGDGSLNALPYPDGYRQICDQLSKVVRPGGRIAFRLYKTPDRPETVDAARAAVESREIKGFGAFKWRLAMAIVAETGDPNLAVEDIRARFDQLFPDRGRLAGTTGWAADDIDTIDVYKGSPEIYSFPTFDQLRTAIPAAYGTPRLVAAGSYELAERCPLVLMDLKP
jgi:hypothetical protein